MNFTKYLSLTALALLAVLAFYSTPSMACSCMMPHPQTEYCRSDYVVLVRVLRKSTSLVEHQDAYKVEIKKSYKMTPEGQNVLKHGRLLTSAFGNMCGIQLTLGKLYVIAGRGARVGLCNYVKEYKDMTIIERKGFSGVYGKACSCDVSECQRMQFDRCQYKFSACMPATFLTPEGPIKQCRWKRTKLYDECSSNQLTFERY